ncbi:MAG TPA: sigma-70 family RNA polymerase sigma factor [Edaphobacter sp.]|nr:sigma-70 family RNA polymerase sigma factor [Edaphobacter sp.]
MPLTAKVVEMPAPNVREVRDDATLVAQIRSGDEAAMACFYDRYAGVVYSVLLRVLHHPSSAEDLLEEIFLDVWRNPDGLLAVRGNPGAWLVVTARNRAIEALRRRNPRSTIPDISMASMYDLTSEAERQTLAERTRSAVARLAPDQRRVFAMAFFDGLGSREIAEIVGESDSVVRMRIRDALLALRRAARG